LFKTSKSATTAVVLAVKQITRISNLNNTHHFVLLILEDICGFYIISCQYY